MDIALPLLLMLILSFSSVLSATNSPSDCPLSYNCNNSIPILFPFAPVSCPQKFGINLIECKRNITHISLLNHSFIVKSIDYIENNTQIGYPSSFKQDFCDSPIALTTAFLNQLGIHFRFLGTNITIFKCRTDYGWSESNRSPFLKGEDCGNGWKLYHNSSSQGSSGVQSDDADSDCASYEIPADVGKYDGLSLSEVFGNDFVFRWELDFSCWRCLTSEGRCGFDDGRPVCYCKDGSIVAELCKDQRRNTKVLIIVIGLASASAIVCLFLFICFSYYRSRWGLSPHGVFLNPSLSLSSTSLINLESSSFRQRFQGTLTIFSYKELKEATNNFSPRNELGDGGFGIVYHGKLHDGRTVAVKRLYENNYNRLEHFMNEIEILSVISHPNLVSLYGCTTRQSRELLLVYEYINNGSVSDHLHGPCAVERCLTWKVRLSVAHKTAEALAYLHQLEPPIIHRDVKTTNILLDKSFEVKVADFGLSLLLPSNASHISTVPQGTPGYIAPEYHECFQLTDKSDVYSFGVVLMELISSLRAIDFSRHGHDISLASLAVNKIYSDALHELVDSNIGFESDGWVKWSVQAVAELAYRCLASEKEIRPAMNDVAEELRQIINSESRRFVMATVLRTSD